MGGPALDGLEEHHTRLDLSAEVAAVEQLAFERGKKKLSHIALSKQSPTEPIEGRTPTSQQRSAALCQQSCESPPVIII